MCLKMAREAVTEGGQWVDRGRRYQKSEADRVRRQLWGAVSLLQDQTDLPHCSSLCLVMRKSIATQPQGRLFTQALPKFTVTADEFFGKSCSINTRRVQTAAATNIMNYSYCCFLFFSVIYVLFTKHGCVFSTWLLCLSQFE